MSTAPRRVSACVDVVTPALSMEALGRHRRRGCCAERRARPLAAAVRRPRRPRMSGTSLCRRHGRLGSAPGRRLRAAGGSPWHVLWPTHLATVRRARCQPTEFSPGQALRAAKLAQTWMGSPRASPKRKRHKVPDPGSEPVLRARIRAGGQGRDRTADTTILRYARRFEPGEMQRIQTAAPVRSRTELSRRSCVQLSTPSCVPPWPAPSDGARHGLGRSLIRVTRWSGLRRRLCRSIGRVLAVPLPAMIEWPSGCRVRCEHRTAAGRARHPGASRSRRAGRPGVA